MNTGKESHSRNLLREEYVTRAEAAEMVGVKVPTLSNWNSAGRHDQYFKKTVYCSRVYYKRDLVEKFVKDSLSRGRSFS